MGVWSAGPRMTIARTDHVAVPLANGKILVAGGALSSRPRYRHLGLYDPATHTFTATGSLNTPRELHTAVRLPGGKVLIAGGLTGRSAVLGTAEESSIRPTACGLSRAV